jgi:broad specificity phosphatase PhoE
MTFVLRYLSHPQVQIDAKILVPEWGLSDIGVKRTNDIKTATALKSTSLIISSNEKKAIETAVLIAESLGLSVKIQKDLHENNRNSTGFLKPDEFEIVASQFFAEPEKNVRGWEKAIDAQSRIVSEVENIFSNHKGGDILMVGHGGVGTLLMCHFAGFPISRQYDQPSGGGNFFSVQLNSNELLHQWLPMEKL